MHGCELRCLHQATATTSGIAPCRLLYKTEQAVRKPPLSRPQHLHLSHTQHNTLLPANAQAKSICQDHPHGHTSIHQYINTSIHPYIHTSIHPYIHTSIHPYIHTSIHLYIHTHIHTYIQIYAPSNICSIKPMLHQAIAHPSSLCSINSSIKPVPRQAHASPHACTMLLTNNELANHKTLKCVPCYAHPSSPCLVCAYPSSHPYAHPSSLCTIKCMIHQIYAPSNICSIKYLYISIKPMLYQTDAHLSSLCSIKPMLIKSMLLIHQVYAHSSNLLIHQVCAHPSNLLPSIKSMHHQVYALSSLCSVKSMLHHVQLRKWHAQQFSWCVH